MATVPDCKLQLLVRKQEKAVEQDVEGKRNQMAQKPVQKWQLLKKSHTKPVKEPGLGNEVIGEVPPESACQDPFIHHQTWQQQHCTKNQLSNRKSLEDQGCVSGGVETKEQRPGRKDQKQTLVKRKSRKQRQRWRKTQEKRLEGAEVLEQSVRSPEALEWRLNPKETEERPWKLFEPRGWKKSSRKAQERNKNPVESQEQASGGSEMRLSPGEESKGNSGEPGTEQSKSREKSGLLETQRCLSPGEFRALSSGIMEVAERRLNPRGNVEMSSGQLEVQNRMNFGKGPGWCPGGSEAEEQKLGLSDPGYKKLKLLKAAEKKAGDGGRMVNSLRSHSSVTSFFLLKKVGIGGSGPQHPLLPSVSLLSPAPPSGQSPESLLMNMLGGTRTACCHSRLWSRLQATYLLPEPQLPKSKKEQYPTSEEISVVGGYISLNRSCLAKSSSQRRRKHLKISFKEPTLESIYYYPSESSMLKNSGSTLNPSCIGGGRIAATATQEKELKTKVLLEE